MNEAFIETRGLTGFAIGAVTGLLIAGYLMSRPRLRRIVVSELRIIGWLLYAGVWLVGLPLAAFVAGEAGVMVAAMFFPD